MKDMDCKCGCRNAIIKYTFYFIDRCIFIANFFGDQKSRCV